MNTILAWCSLGSGSRILYSMSDVPVVFFIISLFVLVSAFVLASSVCRPSKNGCATGMQSMGWNGGYGMGGMLVIPTPGMHIPAGSHGVPIYGVRSHSQSPTQWQSSPFRQPGSNGSQVSASARSPRHQPSSSGSESSSSSLRGQKSLFAEPQGQPPGWPGGGPFQLTGVNSYNQVNQIGLSL